MGAGQVLPAHAGMILYLLTDTINRASAPRTCGDDPDMIFGEPI